MFTRTDPPNTLTGSILNVCVAIAVLLPICATAQSANANDSNAKDAHAKKLEAVTVTGSRIRGVDIQTQQPVFVMTAADIQKTGLTNVGDIVQQMTTMGIPGFNKTTVLNAAFEQGGSYANMRNLGTQRVLVLVNGKRWVTGIAGYTDLSTIPSALVARIEILKDGASAIYGSDAISGVINFILKDRFDGTQASAYYGQNQHGDGQTSQYNMTAGANNDRSSIVFSVTYNNQSVVNANSRTLTEHGYGPANPYGTLEAGPWGLIRNPLVPGQLLMLNHANGVGAGSNNPANYHVYTGTIADKFDFTSEKYYNIPSRLKSAFTHATYKLTDSISAEATAMYSDRWSRSQLTGYPLSSTAQPNFPIYVDAQSYYNPYPGHSLFFNRLMAEVPVANENDFKSVHFDGSLKGYLDLGQNEWDWNAGFNYNHGSGVINGFGNYNLLALQKALGPSFLNGSGIVQCGTASNPVPLGTNFSAGQCTPFNILGGLSASTPQALSYVAAPSTGIYGTTDTSFTADVTGTLFELPAGHLALATGVESRHVSGYDKPDAFAQTGYTTNLAANSTQGSYRVNEAYAELSVPLFRDAPGAKMLNIDVASRYSHYSNFGGTTNSKFSVAWRPINDLLVRGTYSQGFRAPTIGDLFGGGSQTHDYILDPCDSVFGAAASNPTVAARCRAQGVPANFRQTDAQGLPITVGLPVQSSYPFYTGTGNLTLQPETSTSKTIGFVYSPSYIHGLDMSVDWYEINVQNEITGISAQYVLNQCYIDNSTPYCAAFGRDPTSHQITTLSHGNANLGFLATKGYDVAVNYQFAPTRWGDFAAHFEGNYTTGYETQSGAGAVIDQIAGQFPIYHVRANASLDWHYGNFGATWLLQYYGPTRDACYQKTVNCSDPHYTSPSWPYGTGSNRVGSTAFNDLNVQWQAPWHAVFTLGINNIFNKSPEVIYIAKFGGYNQVAAYDPTQPIDRFWYASYAQKF